MQSLSKGFTTLLEVIVIGGLIVSVLIETKTSIIWSFINSLQLIFHTSLLRIPYSANFMTMIKAMISILRFDLFDASGILEYTFHLRDKSFYQAYDESFSPLSYDSSSFIYLLGTPLVFFYILIAAFIGQIMLKIISSRFPV